MTSKKERFDVEKLTEFAINEINFFSTNHQDETFYGFSIDENLLCLNSIEKFNETLALYRKNWGGYTSAEDILKLKTNTGDWSYQGFAKFGENEGFDMEAYLEHYHANDWEQKKSDYAKAMNSVIENLKTRSAFKGLKKTDDFYINRVEHNT